MERKRIEGLNVAQAVLSLAFLLGIVFVFHPCGPKEDGSWMHCHQAGVAVAICAGVLLALSLVRLPVRARWARTAVAVLEILVALLAAFIPGHIVSLCMMADMRCRAVMRPAAMVFSVLIILGAAGDLILEYKRGKA